LFVVDKTGTKKRPTFLRWALNIFFYLSYKVGPPPCSAGIIIMTTTIIIAVITVITLFTFTLCMKEFS
jgi:hypothetical protein